MSPAKKKTKAMKESVRKSPARKTAGMKKSGSKKVQTERLWLEFPPKLITRPVLYELSHKFDLVTNIRQTTITEDIGLTSLELTGTRSEFERATKWLKELGIKIKPIDGDVLSG